MNEFTLTFWSWFGLVGNLATVAVSLAILLVLLGIVRPSARGGPYWHRSNLWLALFLFSLFGQVASGQFTNFLFWLKQGNPLVSFWISLSFFSASGVLLYAFVGHLVGLRGRAFRVSLAAGILAWLVATSLIFQGTVVTDIRLNEAGLLRYDITSLGYVLSALPFVYQFAALGLLVYYRRRLAEGPLLGEDSLFVFGVGALVIGPILVLLQVERFIGVAIPYTSLGPLVGVSIIGYTVARRQVFDPLRQLTFELEHQVAERTRELEQASEEMRQANEGLNRRAEQLQAAINVTREVASSLDLDLMLHRAVELIHARWGHFCVALDLIDDRGEWAVLQASAGEAATQLKKIRHKLRVGADTPVGYVTARGEPRLTFDLVELESIKITERPQAGLSGLPGPNSVTSSGSDFLLPGARSGLTLPLKVGMQVIGALDLQSVEDTFVEEEDVAVLQTLADHLAVAIENARLHRRTEAQLDELATLYRRYSQQLWQALPDSMSVIYRQGQLQTVTGVKGLEESGHRGPANLEAELPDPLTSDSPNLFTVPIKLHNETIGLLGFRKDDAGADWSASEKSLVETIVSQMAMALENARLLEESRRRAQREQWIAEISDRIRTTVDQDTIMQTAVRELSRALRASEGLIRLGTPDQLVPARDNGGDGAKSPPGETDGEQGREVKL